MIYKFYMTIFFVILGFIIGNVKYVLMFYPKHICSTKKYVGTKYKLSTNETLTPLGATYCVYTPVMYVVMYIVHCTYVVIVLQHICRTIVKVKNFPHNTLFALT